MSRSFLRWLIALTIGFSLPAGANPLTTYAHASKKPHGAALGRPSPGPKPSYGRWKPGYINSSGKYISGHFTGLKPHPPTHAGF